MAINSEGDINAQYKEEIRLFKEKHNIKYSHELWAPEHREDLRRLRELARLAWLEKNGLPTEPTPKKKRIDVTDYINKETEFKPSDIAEKAGVSLPTVYNAIAKMGNVSKIGRGLYKVTPREKK